MYKQKNFIEKIIPYLLATLFIFFLSYIQFRSPDKGNVYFLVLFTILVLSVTELVSTKAGIYASTLALTIQVIELIFVQSNHSNSHELLIIALLLLIINYFFIKILRVKRFEQTSEREKHFRSLVNASLQPMILKNEKGEVLFASESINNLLGLKNNIVQGKVIDEFLHPQDLTSHKNYLADILNNPSEKKSIELRMKKQDAGFIWIKIDSINLLKHADIKAIVSSLQDITFQKELDREKGDIIKQEKSARAMAEKAVKDRDEFLSIASHELKTPLTTVILQLQATLRKISTQSLVDFSGGDLMNSLQIAEKQSQRLATLIKDLLNVSLASTGRLTLNKERVNLSPLVTSLIGRFDEEVKISGCKLKIDLVNSEIIGDWDPVRIEQVISNILMNALKHSKSEEVYLTAKKDNNWGYLAIKDKGKGITQEDQKKIFEPFERIDNDKGTEGLGVGLFIAKQIAVAHGGDIIVESKTGKGSTFTLKLPISNK